ncbi:hypothetical protein [Pasteuria penetrans]|nr:hypothetical protein [Pasteuria penetrans]
MASALVRVKVDVVVLTGGVFEMLSPLRNVVGRGSFPRYLE